MNTIQEKLRNSFRLHGSRVAIRYRNNEITYDQLYEKVLYYIQQLESCVQEEEIFVGLLVNDKVNLVAGMMAILGTGKAFVPVDPSWPADRMNQVARIMNLRTILIEQPLDEKIEAGNSLQLVYMDDAVVTAIPQPAYLLRHSTPDAPVYVFFTSGTSGIPKPVVGKNESLCHFINWEMDTFGLNENSRISQFASPAFDAVLRDVFVPFCAGGALCIPDSREVILDPVSLAEWVNMEGITLIHCVPSVFRILKSAALQPDWFMQLRYIIMAGEELKPNELKRWFDVLGERIGLVNLYGATEVTMAKTCYFITKEDLNRPKIPLGKPISGAQVVVLDNRMEICDHFIPGEIYIRTPYRSAGYYGDEVLTQHKFVQNPYSSDPNDLLYRTGDLGRMLPDGNVEYQGRIDDQVKIRGNRVEPGEVENYLLGHAGVSNCVVISRQDEDSNYFLCAYYIPRHDVTVTELQEYLSSGLPDYMVPAYLIPISAIPLTPNGKVDKDALPAPTLYIDGDNYVAPRDAVEAGMVTIWAELLRTAAANISIDANFFSLGGNSLKLMMMMTRIHQSFNIRLPLSEFFKLSTIRSISRYIRTWEQDRYKAIVPAEKKHYYPLTPAQRRVYYIQQMEPSGTAYNMPRLISLPAGVTAQQVQDALYTLLMRHESLRTTFHLVNEVPVQQVHDYLPWEVAVVLSGEGEDVAHIQAGFVQPFDLARGPLLRAVILEQAGGNALLLDIHHIINDGTSETILEKEFLSLLSGETLPASSLQYRDYASWQVNSTRAAVVAQQATYWKNALGGTLPRLQLPHDYARGIYNGSVEQQETIRLSAEVTTSLKQLAVNNGVTLQMLCLAGFQLLLSAVSGQDDIITGLPVEGREHGDAEQMIGMFINFLVIRSRIERTDTVASFLTTFRDDYLLAQEHRQYPFDELVLLLDAPRQLHRNPVFDAVFNFLNQFGTDRALTEEDLKRQVLRGAKVDLLVRGLEAQGELIFNFNYNNGLFKASTIKVIADVYQQFLSTLESSFRQPLTETVLFRTAVPVSSSLKVPLPYDTIQSWLSESFAAHTGKEAIRYGDTVMSYGELEEAATAAAIRLQAAGLQRGDLVGIWTSDRRAGIAVILGVLKAGGVFVPLDTAHPVERILSLIKNNQIGVLIADAGLPEIAGTRSLDIQACIQPPVEGSIKDISYTPQDAVYLFFTSGTTGVPKGVTGCNEGLCHFINWETTACGIPAGTRVSHLAAAGFDASLRDIFVALCNGGTICIPASRDILLHPRALANWLNSESIQQLHCVPGVFRILNSQPLESTFFKALRYILMAGEELRPNDLKGWYEIFGNRIGLVNLYGATEVTMAKTACFLTPADAVREKLPVGQPFPGAEVFVLGSDGGYCPTLTPGEIYIRTPYRSLGYYGDEILTRQKFVQNPGSEDPADWLYRTGDLGRMLPDGNVEYLGRIDDQVKIRGNRVEPGEIENHVLSYPGITGCVVTACVDADGNYSLCAYYMGDVTISTASLREYLAAGLPDYMVPAYLMPLTEIPLTANGKVDKAALPEPVINIDEDTYVAPRNRVEEQVVAIWGEILKVDKMRISMNANFFAWGGDSIKIILLLAQIWKRLAVKITVTEVFRYPTVEAISRYIHGQQQDYYKPIVPAEKKQYYPLTPAQRRIYYIQQTEPASTAYNMPRLITLPVGVTTQQVQDAFSTLLMRHESLRTTFHLVNGIPVQQIHDQLPWQAMVLSGERAAVIPVQADFVQPFDLTNGPLLRAVILEKPGGNALLLDIHHIINDATSETILVKEFLLLVSGETLPPPSLQYRDYASWQVSNTRTAAVAKQAAYWKDVLGGTLPRLQLPHDYARGLHNGSVEQQEIVHLSQAATASLKQLAVKNGVTLQMLCLAGFQLLLSAVSGQDDIITGLPVEGREHGDADQMIGMFINFLVIRNRIVRSETVASFLTTFKEDYLLVQEHRQYPFDDLVSLLDAPRQMYRNPVFDVAFNFLNQFGTDRPLTEEDLKRPVLRGAKVDLLVSVVEVQEALIFNFNYNNCLFQASTIKVMADLYQQFLSTLEGSFGLPLTATVLFRTAVPVSSSLKVPLPYDTIQSWLSESFAAHTGKEAIRYGDTVMSYGELEEAATAAAIRLQAAGLQRGDLVGIWTSDRRAGIAVILGVLKAGGVFVPLDTAHPVERILSLIKNNQIGVLIADAGLPEIAGTRWLDIQACIQPPVEGSIKDISYAPQDAVYLFFTSGTTGVPKGVTGCNEGLCHFINWETTACGIPAGTRVSHLAAAGFDASLRDIFVALCNGGTICIPASRDILLHPGALANWLNSESIQQLHCVPGVFRILNSQPLESTFFKALRYILMAGEELRPNDLKGWYEIFGNRIGLVNLYGATEVTMAKTACFLTPADAVREKLPVGQPFPGAEVFVLGRDGGYCPTLTPGEIYIRTPYRSLGYYEDEILTRQKFVQNPGSDDPADWLYRTGDLGRMLPDGNVEYLGRIDDQVKIRGNRVEPGEIENHVLSYPGITGCVVTARVDAEGNYSLCAYYTGDVTISTAALREYLAAGLPDYMVPAYLMPLPEIPLTANGKVDKAALPEPVINTDEDTYMAARDRVEEQVTAIWEEVLKADPGMIGIDDKFFSVGGNSLRLLMVITRMHQLFNIRVPLSAFFSQATIRSISRYIRTCERERFCSILLAEKKSYYALSSAQRRIYYIQQMDPLATAYNMPRVVVLPENVATAEVKAALQTLLARHESLRTVIRIHEGEPVQCIVPVTTPEIAMLQTTEADKEDFFSSLLRPFDLHQGPPVQMSIIATETSRYLLVDLHHIISDGVSELVLLRELMQLLQNESLPATVLQYKDFSVWQHKALGTDYFNRQEQYWSNTLSGKLKALKLPEDFSRSGIQRFRGNSLPFRISREQTALLRKMAADQGITLYMILFAVYTILMSKLGNREEVIAGVPLAGRNYKGAESTVGLFINTIPIRTFPAADKSFISYLSEVKETLLLAFENQYYPIDLLIDKLDIEREPGRSILFDIMFDYHNEHLEEEFALAATAPGANVHMKTTKFDLNLHLIEMEEDLHGKLDFSTDLFETDTAAMIVETYQRLMDRIAAKKWVLLKDLDIINLHTDQEKNIKEIEFNF